MFKMQSNFRFQPRWKNNVDLFNGNGNGLKIMIMNFLLDTNCASKSFCNIITYRLKELSLILIIRIRNGINKFKKIKSIITKYATKNKWTNKNIILIIATCHAYFIIQFNEKSQGIKIDCSTYPYTYQSTEVIY